MLVDFHTHLDHYDEISLKSAVDCIARHKILTVAASCSISSWQKNLRIAHESNGLIIPTFGVHPSYCDFLPESEAEIASILEPYLQKSALIGEIGLDFFWETKIPHQKQEKAFLACLDHCNRTQKYAVIHTKGAEERIADLLTDFPVAKPVIHWYDGSESTFRTYIERGYFQTFGCEVRYSAHIQHLLKICPPDLLLCETDNPTGEPWLCNMHEISHIDNTPLLIKRVLEDVAKVKNLPLEEIEAITERNARRILENHFSHK